MKKFTRKIENFTCEHCNNLVKGDGYTNHCPNCLYSKHVDINPGDRASSCGGLMKPVQVFLKNGEYVIKHQCTICGYEKNNKTSPNDNFEKLLKINQGLEI
ncbi:MAG: hypothetical protein JWO40_171 [Candidatus Doudnabacteria bacterium]|nr:hypothetical protein [Candidatus Doudnabacteria bacterium]